MICRSPDLFSRTILPAVKICEQHLLLQIADCPVEVFGQAPLPRSVVAPEVQISLSGRRFVVHIAIRQGGQHSKFTPRPAVVVQLHQVATHVACQLPIVAEAVHPVGRQTVELLARPRLLTRRTP